MKKNKKLNKENFDADEEKLLSSFENGEWRSVKNVAKEKKHARAMASKTLIKDLRINIRLSSSDVLHLKQKAAYEGLPYQTLISSVLHKYASGHLQFS